jgi:hypothetical protein
VEKCFSKVSFYVLGIMVFLLFSSSSIDVTDHNLHSINSVTYANQETRVLNTLAVENWKNYVN